MNTRSLLSLLTGVVGIRFGGAIAALLTQIVLAHALIQHEMGVYLFAVSLASTLGMLMTGGYPALGLTYLARYRARGSRNLFKTFIACALSDIGWLVAILVVVTCAVVAFTGFFESTNVAVLIGVAAAPSVAMIRFQSTYANSARRYYLSFLPDFLLRPVLLLVFVSSVLLTTGYLNLIQVLLGYLGFAYLIIILQAYLLWPQGIFMKFRVGNHKIYRRLLRERAGALLVVALVTVAYSDVATMVAAMFIEADLVAVFGVCMRLAVLVGFVTQACYQIVLPDLADAMASGSSERGRSLLFKANIVCLSLTAAAVVGAIFLGDYALAIFGDTYVAGHLVLVVLLISQVLRAASGMNIHLLSMGGLQLKTAAASILTLMVLATAAAIFTPQYGLLGMALAVVSADLVWAISTGFLAGYKLPQRGDILAVIPKFAAQKL